MGSPRPKPKRLAEKLRAIRLDFGLSQTDMLRRLGLDDTMHYSRISEYEQGAREPSLITLLKYAHVAGIHMEDIVDDALDLPEVMSNRAKHDGETKSTSRKRKL
jgi:transcriptional regulator with XRE-family HTH domain